MGKILEVSLQLQLGRNMTQPLPTINDYQPKLATRATSGMWLVSLMLSLFVALFSILAKQWLVDYSSRNDAPAASARRWAFRHMVYKEGLAKWRMGDFVSTLPVLLHLSVFIFLAGLVIYMWQLDTTVAAIIAAGTSTMTIIYLLTTLLPLWKGDYPTVTPLLRLIYKAWRSVHPSSRSPKEPHFTEHHAIFRWLRPSPPKTADISPSDLERADEESVEMEKNNGTDASSITSDEVVCIPPPPSPRTSEAAFHEERLLQVPENQLATRLLAGMAETLLTREDVGTVLNAVGALDPADPAFATLQTPKIRDLVLMHVVTLCSAGMEDPVAIARCLRAMLAVRLDATAFSELDRRRVTSALQRWKDVKTHDLHVLASFAGVKLFPSPKSSVERDWNDVLEKIREWTWRNNRNFSIAFDNAYDKVSPRTPPQLHETTALLLTFTDFFTLPRIIDLAHSHQPWLSLGDTTADMATWGLYTSSIEDSCRLELERVLGQAWSTWCDHRERQHPLDRWLAISRTILENPLKFPMDMSQLVVLFQDYVAALMLRDRAKGLYSSDTDAAERILGWMDSNDLISSATPSLFATTLDFLKAVFCESRSRRIPHWSGTLNAVFRRLFALANNLKKPSCLDEQPHRQMLSFIKDRMAGAADNCVITREQLDTFNSPMLAQYHCFAALVRRTSGPSIWHLICTGWGADHDRLTKLTPVMSTIATQLCALHERGVDVSDGLDELFAVIPAMEIILADPLRGLRIAQHCRHISGSWWGVVRVALLNVAMASFVTDVEHAFSCSSCLRLSE